MLSNILSNFMHIYKITGHKSWHHISGFLTSTLTWPMHFLSVPINFMFPIMKSSLGDKLAFIL